MIARGIKKRFYEKAEAREQDDGLYAIALDGRPVRTPGGRLLAVAQPALAQAMAAEWQAQDASVKPATMPLTQLVNSALDLVETDKEKILDHILSYGETDLLCYWAEEPMALVERQQSVWQPLLDWLRDEHGIGLQVTRGVLPHRQPQTVRSRLGGLIAGASHLELAALSSLTASAGSIVLALAVHHGRLDAAAAFDAAQLEETFQMEKWGEDSEATARRAALRTDIEAACRLLDLCRTSRLH